MVLRIQAPLRAMRTLQAPYRASRREKAADTGEAPQSHTAVRSPSGTRTAADPSHVTARINTVTSG
jgi:hypothetical protein